MAIIGSQENMYSLLLRNQRHTKVFGYFLRVTKFVLSLYISIFLSPFFITLFISHSRFPCTIYTYNEAYELIVCPLNVLHTTENVKD